MKLQDMTMQDMKIQDMKMTDQVTGREIAEQASFLSISVGPKKKRPIEIGS